VDPGHNRFYEFWRFVYVQQEIGKAAQTIIAYPPMQKGATFNLEALKQGSIKDGDDEEPQSQ
jgi:hypothetical protein